MKKFFLTALCFLGGSLFAFPQCSPELASPLNRVYQLPEGRALINQAESEGRLIIKAGKLGAQASNAAWFPDQRTIVVNFSNPRSEGSLICSLIFELNNALSQYRFDRADQLAREGKLNKQQYIREVEYIEFLSAQQTDQLLKKGVSSQLFPSDAYYSIAPNFEEHYRVQVEAGHSNFIAGVYDDLTRTRRMR